MSVFLDKILNEKNRATSLKVVFVDVIKYSKRRSLTQAQVVDAFMECLESARTETAKLYVKYSEDNKSSFKDDVIFLPTGDGAAICFPFEGLHDVHLSFAKEVLKSVGQHNAKFVCEKFAENSWCNCHANFNLRVGVADGRAILYKDINKNYNVAGTVINMAGRVMNLADDNQIIFTEEAYRELIDMVNDPVLDQNFKAFTNIKIKHDYKISVYQYIDSGLGCLNSAIPEKMELSQMADNAMEAMKTAGFPMPNLDASPNSEQAMKLLKGLTALFGDSPNIVNISNQK